MPVEQRFPESFALIRDQYTGGPKIQFFYSEEVHKQPNGRLVYEIKPASWAEEMTSSSYTIDFNYRTNDDFYTARGIYELACFRGEPTGNKIFYWQYWYLPCYFRRNEMRIPVIEFQYKSWLPFPRFRLDIENPEILINHLRTINKAHTEQMGGVLPTITRNEIVETRNRGNRSFEQLRNISPVRIRRRRTSIEEEDLPLAFRVHEEPEEAKPPQPLNLPDHVGQLLIKSARSGKDSCPITAESYSSCLKLSATSCFHVFETSSIEKWRSEGQNICPVCRTVIVNIVKES